MTPSDADALADRPTRQQRRPWDTVVGRTILIASAAALITAFVTFAVSLVMIRTSISDQARITLANFADVAAATLEDPRPGSIGRLRALLAAQDAEAFLVVEGGPLPEGVPAESVAALVAGEPVSTTISLGDEDFYIEGRPVGSGGIVVAASAEFAREVVQDTYRRLVLALLVGLASAVVVAFLASQRLSKPLRRAAEGAEQLVAGRRDVQLPTDGPVEIAEMADAINRLSRALQMSEGRQREFLLTVSHELRTPLTAVTGYAEALADGVVPTEDVARTGDLMLAESRRLERLVADLLDLSRLGAANLRIDRKPTDLREPLQAAAAVWRDRCEREGVRLQLHVPEEPVVVTTDPGRLRQVLDNLAENALRVTPADGVIVFALRRDADRAVLQVRDSGPGLTPQDVVDAFEPGALYSRYRGVRPVSSGVGLAVVGRLAARLGGVAEAGTSAEGGAAFSVSFPTDPAAP